MRTSHRGTDDAGKKRSRRRAAEGCACDCPPHAKRGRAKIRALQIELADRKSQDTKGHDRGSPVSASPHSIPTQTWGQKGITHTSRRGGRTKHEEKRAKGTQRARQRNGQEREERQEAEQARESRKRGRDDNHATRRPTPAKSRPPAKKRNKASRTSRENKRAQRQPGRARQQAHGGAKQKTPQQEKDLVLTLADVWEPMGQRLSPPLLFDVAPTSVTSSPLT